MQPKKYSAHAPTCYIDTIKHYIMHNLRPIIEGETEWDLDDDLEPADLSHLEQVADGEGLGLSQWRLGRK